MKKITIQPLKKPITKTISIPGSKSYTNRALLLASLVKNDILITNPLESDDTDAMVNCLQTLGVPCEKEKDAIRVIGSIKEIIDKEFLLNARLSGTTIRFILALCMIIPGKKILQGNEGLTKRPIGDLVKALRNLGGEITYLKNEGFPPLQISSSKLTKHHATVSGNLSSQFLSALLLIAPIAGIETISVIGEQVSKAYIDMTISIMQAFGVHVTNNSYSSYVIPQNEYKLTSYAVEGDFSGAGYFAAIAVLSRSTITLENLRKNSVQGDKEFIKILGQMGNTITWENNNVTIIGKQLTPVTVDMHNCPDQIQTLAVLSAFARGDTKITGIKTLRVKETDRVHAILTELGKMGIQVTVSESELIIHGGEPKPARIATYGDHRMAMSFAMAGAKLAGMVIEEPDVVTKTFPEFWYKLYQIGVKTHEI